MKLYFEITFRPTSIFDLRTCSKMRDILEIAKINYFSPVHDICMKFWNVMYWGLPICVKPKENDKML